MLSPSPPPTPPPGSGGDHTDSEVASALSSIAAAAGAFLTEVHHHGFGARADSLPRPYEHDPEKGFTMDIMMMMDMAKVSALRREFQQKDRGLSIAEFVHVMVRFVHGTEGGGEEHSRLRNLTERQLIANLCELFAQIDINGDGSMEWEEFTSFIVETGLTAKSHQPNSIQHYHHVQWEDASKHSTFIDHIYYFPTVNQIALIENCSSVLKLYNTECEFEHSIKSPEGFVQCAEHIPKLDQFVLASSDLQFRFYDDSNLRLVKSCHTPTSQTCLKWYAETTTLFSAGVSGVVYAWDAERMEERHHMGGEVRGRLLTRSHDDIVLDLLTLPTLESLASASMDRTIRLWDVHTGKHKQQLDGHQKGVRSLAYSPEYRFLVSAGFDFDALVWNPYVDQLILRLHGHSNSLCSVEIIPDTPQIITADVDGVFKVWDIRNFACMQTFTAENMGDVKKIVAVTPQKRIVAAGKKLTKFDYEKLENPELTDDYPVFAALYNPTSLSFVTAAGRDVKVWDARLGKLLRVYRGLSDSDLTALTLDCRERKLILGDHGGLVQVFDYLNGSHMKSFAYPEVDNRAHLSEVSRLCYCAEHMAVVSASWDGAIDIHDESESERGVLLRRLVGGHTTDISALCYSSTLSLIASGSSDGTLHVWDFEFGRLDATCIGHVSGVLALAFLDPYPLLLSTDNNGNACLWGTRPSRYKGKCVYRFRNQRGASAGGGVAPVSCVTVLPSPSECDESEVESAVETASSYLVVTGDDKGVVSVWDLLPVLAKLEEDYGFTRLARPVECVNARRNLRVNAESMVRKVRNGPEFAAFRARDPTTPFFFAAGMPLVDHLQPACRHQWRAHSDIVYSVQPIRAPPSLVTSSFDRRVKVWSLAGECLGILMQGDMALAKRPWKFRVDYDARERKKEQAAEPVIDEVHALAQAAEREAKAGGGAEAVARRRRRARERKARDRERARGDDESERRGDDESERRASTNDSTGIHGASDDDDEGGDDDGSASTASASVLEEIVRAPLPQLPPLVGLRGPRQPPLAGGVRKTPRRVPVGAATAGRMQILSPRQLRVLSRAGTLGHGSNGGG